MRYAQIRSMDISNGEGVGVALFVQGCDMKPHCKNCFNQDTWDFNGGKEWTRETKNKFLELIERPYIKRVSFLGGECLADRNLEGVYGLIETVKKTYPEKILWMYTGYTWETIFHPVITDDMNFERDRLIKLRQYIVSMCDVLIDGKYIHELKDMNLEFRGSSNQRIIDVKKSLESGEVVLWKTSQ